MEIVPVEYRSDPERWSLEKIRLAIKEMRRFGEELGFEVHFVLIAPQAVYLNERSDEWANHSRQVGGQRYFPSPRRPG